MNNVFSSPFIIPSTSTWQICMLPLRLQLENLDFSIAIEEKSSKADIFDFSLY